MKKNSRILVTGGAGFIGSHLCDYLSDVGHDVIVIDNLSSGHEENISGIIEDIEYYNDDIETFKLSVIESIDCIVHLAAQTSVPRSISNFHVSSCSNLVSSINILDFCRSNQIPLVFASSASVYGNNPFGDDADSNIELLSPYSVDKYTTELFAEMANKTYGLSSIALRFFNVYGERQDPNNKYSGVISKFIDRMLKEEEVTIYGGPQTRDFIYVNDVIRTIYQAIEVVMDQNHFDRYNVLTGRTVSIDDLFELLSNSLNYSKPPIYKNHILGDPKQSSGATKKMIDKLSVDIEAFTPLEEGLLRTIQSIADRR